MIEFNLVYQILVLVMLGASIILEALLLRKPSISRSFDTRVSNGDTNVSLQTKLTQGESTIAIPPVTITAPMPQPQPQQEVPARTSFVAPFPKPIPSV